MPRRPIGAVAMTAAERQWRRRARLRAEQPPKRAASEADIRRRLEAAFERIRLPA